MILGPLQRETRAAPPTAARITAFGVALLCVLACAYLAGPVLHTLTNQGYADRRLVLGIPNFENVLSNLAFLLVGAGGLLLCRTMPRDRSAAWRVFYLGLVLTCFGSAWYHLAPSDGSIVWDRLGMTVSFVGLAVAVLQESTKVAVGGLALAAVLLAGAASVVWWRISGDLRPYAFVQAAPLALVAVSVLRGWVPVPLRRALTAALALYLAAKLAELLDAGIYEVTRHWVSGHTLKHLLAAAATGMIFLQQLTQRRLMRPQTRTAVTP